MIACFLTTLLSTTLTTKAVNLAFAWQSKTLSTLKGSGQVTAVVRAKPYSPPKAATTPCLQALLDLGTAIIGKTKIVQFASEAYPIDFFDVQCSFNLRGDGYQPPSMSSAGSAAAVAG